MDPKKDIYQGLTRERLLEAIAWQLGATNCVKVPGTLPIGVMRTMDQDEARAAALGVSRVVEGFIRWVERLQKVQMEALSVYTPNLYGPIKD